MTTRLLQNVPIKRKLTVIIMVACTAALLLAGVSFGVYEEIEGRRNLALDLSILTDVFDDNLAPGLAFNDPKSVEQTLKSLDGHPHILAAVAYDKAGQVVGRYQRAGVKGAFPIPVPQETGTRFVEDRLDAFRRVMLAGEMIGTIYVASDLTELSTRFWRYVGILAGVLFFASLVVLWLSAMLQKIISEPIFHLARTAATVATEKNYAIRAVKHGKDELGTLIDGFNEMLVQIQSQNNALEEARENLEQRVEERTKELQLEVAERKQAQDSLTLLSSAIEQSADAVVITRRDGVIEYANGAFLELSGYARPEVIGQTPRILNSHQHSRAFFEDLWKTILSGKLFQAEFINRKKSGSLYSEEKTIGPVIDSKGAITHFIATGRDITERKRKEGELAQLHKQLLDTSRAAGMAEVATGVLHNVGNVLNSVNVSATLLTDNMKKSKAASLTKVAALLEEHACDLGAFISSDAKGKQLPGYLGQLATHLAGEQKAALSELETLRKNIEHIKDIVAMQQNYAKVSGVTETVDVTDLVEDTLRMNAGAFQRHDVQVVREFDGVPPICTERHKVLQILVNLVRNAKYACDDSGRSDKQLILRVAQKEERVCISVIDNGVGIPAENLTRIFSHGFTTRKEGHGFGLHSGALAAKELGGALVVQSEGLGRGATFTLELPIQNNGQKSHEPDKRNHD